MFFGSIPALVTPFKDGQIDKKGFAGFIDWQIKQGSNGIVPVGTSGESPTLSFSEHHEAVEIAIEAAAGRVPVIAGTGSNSTQEAIDFSRHAEKAGANGLLIVVPYYNKPTQEGLYLHYKAIAKETSLPILLYNVPGRSSADLAVDTVARLAKDCANIVGIKDASQDLERVSRHRHAIDHDFIQISGEDMTALAAASAGSHGCISVTANVAPKLCSEMQAFCRAGDFQSALAIQDRLTPLHAALFIESNPGPVKYAFELLGHGSGETRLPLAPIKDETKAEVRKAMVFAGLIN